MRLKLRTKELNRRSRLGNRTRAARGVRMLRFNADTVAEARTLKSVIENGPESHFECATAIGQSRKEIVAIHADVHIDG